MLRVAWRNLGRARARTALSVASIAAAVMVVVLLKGVVDGILGTMEDSTIRLSSGHVRVIDQEYRRRERLLSLQYPVDGFDGEGYQAMVDSLTRIEGVALVAPRLRFAGLISREDELRSTLVVAGDPGAERELLRVDRYLAEGRFLEPGAREAVMGRRLLQRLDMQVGDRFTLVFSTALGALRGYTLTVVGAFESGLTYLDDGAVFIPLDVAQAALDMGPAVTEVLLMGGQPGDARRLKAEVDAVLAREGAADRYLAVPWYEHNEITGFLETGRRIYDGIYIGLLVLASFVVVNTYTMIVNERRREIGMLSALGMRPGQVRALFLLEGALSGLLGSVLGAAVGALVLAVLARTGLPMPGVEALGEDFMYPTVLYPAFSAGVVAYAVVGGIAVTVAAVYLPAAFAARLRPVEALRG